MIYLVEDDANIRQLVIYTLNHTELPAQGFASAPEFWRAMASATPDLVMLDIMLPGQDGLEILRELRAAPATSRLPVMMLTAKSAEYDKVVGLDMGADDYITKPFGMMELMARVRALLRRTDSAEGAEELTLGCLCLCPGRHTVRVDGVDVPLTLKEFELLTLLMRANGSVVTRDALLSGAWGYSDTAENRTVDVHISTLRQKLGKAGKYITTVRGVGYKMEL
ncbi:MAG: response regulator transcription factor [Oscillospiraceae bacterium]|nr:response regulator transcription factor [Oscillospiraceae bacterium]